MRLAELLETQPSTAALRRLSVTDIVALASVVTLMVAYIPSAEHPWDTPRFAVLLATIPLGVCYLGRLIVAGDRAARVAGFIVAWVAFGASLSRAPAVAFVGAIGRWSSVLVMVAVLCLWVIGRELTDNGRNAVGWVMVSSGALSSAFAVLQLWTKPTDFFMALELGRPVGLAGNPIHYGAQMSAVAAWFVHRQTKSAANSNLIGFIFFSFFAALSGSRIALLAVLAVAVFGALRARSIEATLLVPLTLLTAIAASFAHGLAGTGQSAGDRVGTSGVQDRLDLWSFGLSAWLDRPIQGWGLGRFRPATQSHYSDEWAGRFSDDLAGSWIDAHNFVVEHLVTTGLVGVLAIAAFAWFAGRSSAGPWSWMAAVIGIGWLLEPASLPTFGLALLLLGSAPPRLARENVRDRPWLAVSAIVGIVLGSWYFLSVQALNPLPAHVGEDFAVWAIWLDADPGVANAVASSKGRVSEADDSVDQEFVLAWSQRAVEREPDMAIWRANLALRYLRVGDLDGARDSAERGLSLQSNHVPSLEILQIVALRVDDRLLFDSVTGRLCELRADMCATEWFDD